MSQETTNQFSDGLIMDLNPLTTPNSVLTNCLNGTFITFNGNEFVLQNDMGNGRVETAYLPSGYVPVGIKEHGGIIYVASYNPLTNRSQIGSFPSPERNISSEELNDSIIKITDENFFSNGTLVTTVYRLNLSDNILRSGDKFSIISKVSDDNGSLVELSKYISHCNNIGTGGIIYRHNKLLTLRVATEDSSGNLIDITNQLKRIDENNEVIEFNESDTQKIKLNKGYFLQYQNESTDVTTYRQSKALNTYNNKVYGKLYLIAELNNITNYNVVVYGYSNKSNEEYVVTLPDGKQSDPIKSGCTKIIMEFEYQYNCPDGYNGDGIDDRDACPADYYDPNSVIGGSLIEFGGVPERQICKFIVDSNNPYYTPSYNENTNLYTVRNYLEIDIQQVTDDQNPSIIYEYDCTPFMTYGELEGLKISGSIDIGLLGTGTHQINVWKYYINENNTDITWGLISYPLYNWEIKEIIFDFIELSTGRVYRNLDNSAQSLRISKRESYNGTFTNSVNLIPGEIYLVRINIFQCESNKDVEISESSFNYNIPNWVMKEGNTELNSPQNHLVEWRAIIMDSNYYNDFYSTLNDFVKDWGSTPRIIELEGSYQNLIKKENITQYTPIDFDQEIESGIYQTELKNKITGNIATEVTYDINSDVFSINSQEVLTLSEAKSIEIIPPENFTTINNQFSEIVNLEINHPLFKIQEDGSIIQDDVQITNPAVYYTSNIMIDSFAAESQNGRATIVEENNNIVISNYITSGTTYEFVEDTVYYASSLINPTEDTIIKISMAINTSDTYNISTNYQIGISDNLGSSPSTTQWEILPYSTHGLGSSNHVRDILIQIPRSYKNRPFSLAFIYKSSSTHISEWFINQVGVFNNINNINFIANVDSQIYATRQLVTRNAEYLYNKLVYRPWEVYGSDEIAVSKYVSFAPFRLTRKNDYSDGCVLHRNRTSIGDLFRYDPIHTNINSGFATSLWNNLNKLYDTVGTSPLILYMSHYDDNSLMGFYTDQLQAVNQSYTFILWKNSQGRYTIIGGKLGSTLLDSVDLDNLVINNILNRLYIYSNFNNTVTAYVMYGCLYIEDYKNEIDITLNILGTLNPNQVMYKNKSYLDNLETWVSRITKSPDNTELLKFLNINVSTYNSQQLLSIPIQIYGSQSIYYSMLQDIDSFNTATVALVNDSVTKFRTKDGAELSQGFIYYNPPGTNDITELPEPYSSVFTLQDGLPVIKQTLGTGQVAINEVGVAISWARPIGSPTTKVVSGYMIGGIPVTKDFQNNGVNLNVNFSLDQIL